MFSGIIEEFAGVLELELKKGSIELTVKSALDHASTKVGDSIALDGVCLTVTHIVPLGKKASGWKLSFDLAPETQRRSSLGGAKVGDSLHLERSLRVGDRISGHFVFGHVDGIVTLRARSFEGESQRLLWEVERQLLPFIAPKGSVAIAGVSLTVGEVEESTFAVYLVPHTLKMTKLGTLPLGSAVNFECDMLARYVLQSIGRLPRGNE